MKLPLLYIGLCVLSVVIADSTRAADAVGPWPTHAWVESTPEAQGLDSNALADALDFVQKKHIRLHSLQIERNGVMIVDAYVFPFADNELHDLASVTKSVTSTLIGIAIGEQRIPSVDTSIVTLFGAGSVHNMDSRKAALTIGHLLSMTSGLDCHSNNGEITLRQMRDSPHWAQFILDLPMTSDPGTTFEYCSGGMHVLSAALTKTTGVSALEFARTKLFAPLGIGASYWPADPDGVSPGWGDLHLQPRDMAKLGYLWLHNGKWEDQQVVPAAYLASATAVHSRAPWGEDYGYGMWIYPKREPPIYEANGRGGQRISVIPSKNMVVVMTGGGFEPGDVGAFIVKALRSDAALPANSAGYARLKKAIADAARPPPGHAPHALPSLARVLSQRAYTLEKNQLGLTSVAFAFPTASEASIRMAFADGTVQEGILGVDGVPRLTRLPSGRTIGLSGEWDTSALEVQYDQVGDINAFTISFTPSQDRVSVHVVQQKDTGGLDVVINGRRAP